MRQEGRERIVIRVVLPIDIAFPRWLDFHDEFLSRQRRAVQRQIFRYRDPTWYNDETPISNQIMLSKQSSARPATTERKILYVSVSTAHANHA